MKPCLTGLCMVGTMCRVVCSFCVFVYSNMFCVFGSIFRRIFRFKPSKSYEKHESKSSVVRHQEEDQQTGSCCFQDPVTDKSNEEGENSVVMDTASSVSTTSKYEFLSREGISGFIEEPKALSFTIHEVFLDSNDDEMIKSSIIDDIGGCTDDDFHASAVEGEGIVKEEAEEKTGDSVKSSALENQEQKVPFAEEEIVVETKEVFREHELHDKDCVAEESHESAQTLANEDVLEKQESGKLIREKEEVIGGKFDSSNQVQDESISSNDELVDSITNEVLDNRIISEGFGPESPVFIEEGKIGNNCEPEEKLEWDQCTDSDEYIELKPREQNSVSSDESREKHDQHDLVHEDQVEPKTNGVKKHEEPSKSFANSDEQYELDSLLQHQDLIEQLKMELKHARTGGLPTIIEESECEELEIGSPKIAQEPIKPWKIDEKFEHKDLMDEIQKVYKSYLDKMRKLDIFNFQTMHALGLLQLKDSVQLSTIRKSSGPGIKSLLVQNLWSCKQAGTTVVDPTKKMIAGMHMDFEIVYVGHICLSWEMLCWQYWKFQELHKHDSPGLHHQYNQVAGEFQLFQVLLQRFLENETFQGPSRVQNYVKSRCVFRSLLQIPIIKEDSVKDKGKRGDYEDAITSQMLLEILGESMQVFWEFLCTDKDESNGILHVHQQIRFNPQDFVDSKLFINVRNDFQKKEKKLKDIMRSRNCIVKRFQKHQGNQMHTTLFFAQMELKLVSRVLNMSKLTADQLIWCHEKLDRMRFCNRKVFVEPPSVLLFPC